MNNQSLSEATQINSGATTNNAPKSTATYLEYDVSSIEFSAEKPSESNALAKRMLRYRKHLYSAALTSLLGLIILCLLWEMWLAPIRPGGSWLALKALPLVIALPGIMRKKIYTLQWASMLILLYLMEGVVRSMSDLGISGLLAAFESVLSLIFFISTILYVFPSKRAAQQLVKNKKTAHA